MPPGNITKTKKSKPSPLPDPICKRCENKEPHGHCAVCNKETTPIMLCKCPERNLDGSWTKKTQQAFEITLRKKGDKRLKEAKERAGAIDWESAYKVQKEETNEVYKKLDKVNEDLALEITRNKKLHNIIGVGIAVVILLGYKLLS